MLRRIFLTALIAGTLAGLFAAGLQHLKLIPLIAATAAGLGAVIFTRHGPMRVLAAVLLVLPYLVGAPAAPHGAMGVPAGLAAAFASACLATPAAFWLLLGSVSGWLYRRFE